MFWMLRSAYRPIFDDGGYGTMFITNEDENGIIDFVKDDLDYILSKISGELKYNKPSEFTKRWHAYLASLSGPG